MIKKTYWIIVLFLLWSSYALADEKVTIQGYYPSPKGIYDEVHTRKIIVSESWYDPSYSISSGADLVVEGNLGIGTVEPLRQVQVNGKIRITDGNQANMNVLVAEDATGLASWSNKDDIQADSHSCTSSNAGWEPGSPKEWTMPCPSGYLAIGGGWDNINFCTNTDANRSVNSGWWITSYWDSSFTMYTVCIKEEQYP